MTSTLRVPAKLHWLVPRNNFPVIVMVRCQVYVDMDYFDDLPEPEDEEYDMLDLAFNLKEK